MTVDPPACMTCRHYRPSNPVTCDAFPTRIPEVIWLQGNPHTEPVLGDHGIRYERKPDAGKR
jgi:hypothetical protein